MFSLLLLFIFQNYDFWNHTSIEKVLGKEWDIYLMTFLALILGLAVFIRRR